MVNPIAEQGMNKSMFSGHPLIPDRLLSQLPEFQYYPNTTQTAKSLAHVMSNVPGVLDAALDKGSVPLGSVARTLTSPITIENYVNNWAGPLGTAALQITDKSLQALGVVSKGPSAPEKDWTDLPFVHSFFKGHPGASSDQIEHFFSTYTADKAYLDTWKAQIKSGNQEGAEYIAKLGGEEVFSNMSKLEKGITTLYGVIRNINEDRSMEPYEKRQRLDPAIFQLLKMGEVADNAMIALHSAIEARRKGEEPK
jgi:hypothetical protein